MRFEYTLDHVKRRVTIVRSGPTDLEAVLAGLDRQAADGAWGYTLLHDARGATTGLDAHEVQSVADHARYLSQQYGPRGRVAFVTRASALVGSMQIYAILGGHTAGDVQIFWDRDEAERWLDDAR
jgi:hypothetical protein